MDVTRSPPSSCSRSRQKWLLCPTEMVTGVFCRGRKTQTMFMKQILAPPLIVQERTLLEARQYLMRFKRPLSVFFLEKARMSMEHTAQIVFRMLRIGLISIFLHALDNFRGSKRPWRSCKNHCCIFQDFS